tara:strand:+ start:312 stop:572 length:261 start_codon:yes stop_codon:yes gene_type:complete
MKDKSLGIKTIEDAFNGVDLPGLTEGLFLEEAEDGSVSFYEGGDLIARGDDLKDALTSLQLNFELRLEFSISAFIDSAVPNGGFEA